MASLCPRFWFSSLTHKALEWTWPSLAVVGGSEQSEWQTSTIDYISRQFIHETRRMHLRCSRHTEWDNVFLQSTDILYWLWPCERQSKEYTSWVHFVSEPNHSLLISYLTFCPLQKCLPNFFPIVPTGRAYQGYEITTSLRMIYFILIWPSSSSLN